MITAKSACKWLVVSLLLCTISMVGAYFIQTDMGKVTVKDLRWETPLGRHMSALLFIPPNATKETPAPAIVTSHGWYNNREMQDLNFVELARRGYVVASIDMYGHGNSSILPGGDGYKQQGTGFYDAIELLATLPYVDKARIGATGHSNGARAANLSIDADNLKADPLISSVLFIGNDATYQDADKNYYNKYGSRDVGVIAGQFDEFFFRVPQADGKRSSPKDYIDQVTAQSFLNFGRAPGSMGFETREPYKMYTENVDGVDAVRVIYNPYEIHPWNHFSTGVVESTLEFFDATLNSPNKIPPTDQVWLIKAFFNALGLVGVFLFAISFTKVLLATPCFNSLKSEDYVEALPAPQGFGTAWFWLSLVVSVLFSVLSYIFIYKFASTIRPSGLFTQSPVFYIGMWCLATGLFTLLLLVIGYYNFGGREFNLKARGIAISGGNLLKTCVLTVIVVFFTYLLVFVADYFFKVDYRLWVIPFKAFGPDKLWYLLIYLPFFLVFYGINSIAINCFNYMKGSPEWVNVTLLALVNGLSSIIMVYVQYSYFFKTGFSYSEANFPASWGVSNIIGIWLFPIIVFLPLAAFFTRSIFKETKNPYLGAFIFATLVTLISVTNTLTQLP